MVATFVELRSSAVTVSYFERDGYYARNDPEHRQASFWHGDAARALGLRGHVRPKRFESVLAGFVPGTDIRLGRMREGERQHRPGWDLTFSAPKSVSLEALVMGDRRVIRAHDEAVRATLDWVEAELLQTRGWDPVTRRRPRVKAGGMVVAGFRHLTSRDLDPMLHTHCVLANMTRNAAGEWRSVEPTALRRSAKLIGAFYRNELARRLEALGMAVAPRLVGRVPGFELAGYSRAFVEAFSGRRLEIEADLERRNLPLTAANAQQAALRTRRPKRDRGLAELVPAWRARARRLGLAREKAVLAPPGPVDPLTAKRRAAPDMPRSRLAANELRKRKRAPALPKLPRDAAAVRADKASLRLARAMAPAELSYEPETGLPEAVARAVAHVGERRVTIPEAEIRAVALGHAPGRYRLAEVDAAIARLVRGGELVETASRDADRAFVTDRAVKAERRMLASMRAARGKGMAEADADTVEARLRESGLTHGQKQAVRTVLLSCDRVVGVQGHAGSGKTTMLRMAKELLGEKTVLGLAPSASAARLLAREAGMRARTLQWFLTRHGDLSDPARLARARSEFAGAVLAVDEASMIDTVRMEALLRIARDLGVARVALVGDTAQLRAVDAGQPFRVLQKAGMATAVMDEVLRQKDPELKEASGRARAGEPGEAIRRLGRRVREHPREELGPEAGRRWLALPAQDRADTLILAPTHAIRRQVNDTVRDGLEAEGLLHGRVLVVDRLVDRRLTRAQASDIASYEPGDTLVFHRDVFGCRSGDICMVTGKEDGHVLLAGPDNSERRFRPSGNAATYFALCDTERIELRAGERIRWTRNRKAGPAGFGHPRRPELVNGGEADILEIDLRRVRFRDDEGRTFSFPHGHPQLRHLDHAYCSTVHASQGRTARAVIAVLDAHGVLDRALFHVELSRASESFLLLTDDREALVEMLEAHPDREEGALEALGLDPAEPPAVEPELFEALVADWRGLEEQAFDTDAAPASLPGYGEVMARAAALSLVEDLPADMRVFLNGMLADHERHIAHEREAEGLAGRIRDCWRRRPELGWLAAGRGCAPEALPEYPAWREEGTALLEAVRAAPAAALPAGGIEGEVAALERLRLRDDAGRFGHAWQALRERAARASVPELHAEGYADIAALGAVLVEADGLDPAARRIVEAWREVHDGQSALAGAVRSLPERVDAWRARREAGLPLDEFGAVDPADPACRAWRGEGAALADEAEFMREAESPHAPHLDAMPGAGKALDKAIVAVQDTFFEDRYRRFSWLTRHVVREAKEAGTDPYYASRFREAVAHAGALYGDDALSKDRSRIVDGWIDHDWQCEELCREIRNWPRRAAAVLDDRARTERDLDAMRRWRASAVTLLAGARAMQVDGSPHAPHLAAMPEERELLAETAGRLAGAIVESETAELDRLAEIAEEAAGRTGAIAFDTTEYAELMEHVREIDDRPGLPEPLREAVDRHLERHEGLEEDRANVDAFLDLAAELLHDREQPGLTPRLTAQEWTRSAGPVPALAKALVRDIPERELNAHLAAAGAEPGAIGENAAKIESLLREDERARERAAGRLADERALALEAERLRLEEERRQERSQGGGISMS
ncbi:MAG: relaxase domain-containing protein [Alphaproteobacteria bacterium]|nr:relaxase domain-containing protein [Alphaproteobacteria bacterium]